MKYRNKLFLWNFGLYNIKLGKNSLLKFVVVSSSCCTVLYMIMVNMMIRALHIEKNLGIDGGESILLHDAQAFLFEVSASCILMPLFMMLLLFITIIFFVEDKIYGRFLDAIKVQNTKCGFCYYLVCTASRLIAFCYCLCAGAGLFIFFCDQWGVTIWGKINSGFDIVLGCMLYLVVEAFMCSCENRLKLRYPVWWSRVLWKGGVWVVNATLFIVTIAACEFYFNYYL